jgi:hypothetical protein
MRCCVNDEGCWPFGAVLRRKASNLWVPQRQRTLCDLRILVDEAVDAVASLDLVDVGWCAAGEWACGSSLPQGAVWPVTVVVAFELTQHGCGVSSVDD